MQFIAILKFLRANWKVIALVAVAITAYIWFMHHEQVMYNRGMAEGIKITDANWREKYGKDVDALNTKITDTERDSRNAADEALGRINSANLRIDALLAQIAVEKKKFDNYRFDHEGKVVCESTDTLYLGNDFSESWNALNRGALQ